MNKFFLFVNMIAVAGLIFAYLSPIVSPEITWFFSLFGLFYPLIVLINVLFVFFWLWKKPKNAWISGLVLILGFNSVNRMFQINDSEDVSEGIKIMSYNLRGRYLLHSKTPRGVENKIKDFQSFLKVHKDTDIFCFQEQANKTTQQLKKELSGFNVANIDGHRIYIYSKFPIVDQGIIKFESYSHNATWADIAVNKNQIVRVYNVHLSSNRVSSKTEEIITQHDLSETEIWSDIRFIFSKYAKHSKKRVAQSKKLMQHLNSCPHPIILTGDFNDVPQSYVYKMFNNKLQDSFIEAGNGLGRTYRLQPAFLRIDYIFSSDAFKVLNHKVVDCNFSDHYPVSSLIRFAN